DATSPSRAPSQDKAAGATTQKTGTLSYGLRARRPKPPRLGDNPKSTWAVRSNSPSGSKHQGVNELHAGQPLRSAFHPSRCAKANENSPLPSPRLSGERGNGRARFSAR